ncbi:MAG TPA: hypothetical protein VFP47_08185 [Pyrinomonadaceae bacterium]|nr:hypothetical protein [Pyrinomonadaceae bacterium]
MIRTYSELIKHSTFEGRFKYLALRGGVGEPTFGYDRWINQAFYHSREWKQIRYHVIARDNGCDLGIPGHEIHERAYVHHMNPLTPDEIFEGSSSIVDPEFLITVTHQTHNAIHYGDERQLPRPLIERRPGDTKLW